MQYRGDSKGNQISILGYGCMRFTKKGSAIDLEKAEQELNRRELQEIGRQPVSGMLCRKKRNKMLRKRQ